MVGVVVVGIAVCIQYMSTWRSQENKNSFVMSCILYTLYSTRLEPYLGKKAKLFEYAKGLPPDLASLIIGREKLHQ